MKQRKNSENTFTSFKEAIKGLTESARRKAFRNDMPVAISKNGQVYLLYKDNREIPLTPELLATL